MHKPRMRVKRHRYDVEIRIWIPLAVRLRCRLFGHDMTETRADDTHRYFLCERCGTQTIRKQPKQSWSEWKASKGGNGDS